MEEEKVEEEEEEEEEEWEDGDESLRAVESAALAVGEEGAFLLISFGSGKAKLLLLASADRMRLCSSSSVQPRKRSKRLI